MPINPLEDCHDAIWQMYEAEAEFVALFPTGTVHQVRYTSTKDWASDPNLDALAPADYPVCQIVVQSAQPTTERSSSTSGLAVRFVTEIAT